MPATIPPFEFDYDTGAIIYGQGCVDQIRKTIDSHGFERALVVCGSNVGANDDLMDPLTRGIGSALAGVFDETTPGKDIRTAIEGAERIRNDDIDVVVAVGGGSSLDVGRLMCLLAAHEQSFEAVLEETEETGVVPNPDDDASIVPNIAVPTTLAGADMSSGGGIKLEPRPVGEPPLDGEVRAARFGDPRLTSAALFYDPALFETTPTSVLVGSAMNGFDKGIETLYSGAPSVITDSTAIRGLKLLGDSLPALDAADRSDADLEKIVSGIILIQYGRQTSVIHAFGHGISFYYPAQQGDAHAVLAPHVLRCIFERVDGRRALLAEGFGIEPSEHGGGELAELIIDAVIEVRDALGLPRRLRALEGVERGHLRSIAAAIEADRNLERNPAGLELTVDDIEAVLENAW